MQLTQRLGWIIAAAVAPIVLIDLYNAYSLIEQERAKTHRLALDYGRNAAWEMQRILDGLQGVLQTVALSPSVRSQNWEVCERFLQDVLAKLPQLTSLAVADQGAVVRCGPGSAPPVSVADRPYFQQALSGRSFVVGEYTIGRFSNRPVLPLAMPVVTPGNKVEQVVIAAIDLQWLSAILAERGAAPEGSITMADRQGTIIARQPLPERFIGTRIPDAFLHLLHEPAEGSIELTSQDGTERVLGYEPLSVPPYDIYVSAGVGVDYSYAGVYAAAFRSLLVIGLAVSVAILASTLFGRRFIAQPVSRLVATAQLWRAGDLKAKSGLSGRDEFGTLGEVLDGAIDQARRREERITMLMREVTHRVKNQMAVMLSMARQVGRNALTVEQFQKAFSDRIMAMSRSHDLVFSGGEDARLAVLILSQLEPFAIGTRVSLCGPEVWITAQSAQHIGMAMHELATNALKYGAWSSPAGRVDVTWSTVDGEPKALRIVWKEHGGPNVLPRASMGFGSTVLESVVGPALGGWSELTFEATGVRWTCEFAGHFTSTPPASKAA
ncbi:sensor histidine kinase [Dongia deserti]|uniref:sensor histidine kinase n=1 Tax=Dongia deserti TaxID=2268030 RepID=UPI000E64DC2C|nr:HWE histidine kinase domain-containing protein [Dongia deserti]